jgi:hypothetical protein
MRSEEPEEGARRISPSPAASLRRLPSKSGSTARSPGATQFNWLPARRGTAAYPAAAEQRTIIAGILDYILTLSALERFAVIVGDARHSATVPPHATAASSLASASRPNDRFGSRRPDNPRSVERRLTAHHERARRDVMVIDLVVDSTTAPYQCQQCSCTFGRSQQQPHHRSQRCDALSCEARPDRIFGRDTFRKPLRLYSPSHAVRASTDNYFGQDLMAHA